MLLSTPHEKQTENQNQRLLLNIRITKPTSSTHLTAAVTISVCREYDVAAIQESNEQELGKS